MKKTVEIEVCDYPGCGNDKGLAPCYNCDMRVCGVHRFEGGYEGRQAWICWMDMPSPKV